MFRMNPTFLPTLARGPEMHHAMGEVAEEVAREARSIAPVDEGDFRDSIHEEVVIEDGKATGKVIADDPASIHIEFGTSDTPTFATLRKALMTVVGH
jgi:hypothetical protein